jgi:hypothetical protein
MRLPTADTRWELKTEKRINATTSPKVQRRQVGVGESDSPNRDAHAVSQLDKAQNATRGRWRRLAITDIRLKPALVSRHHKWAAFYQPSDSASNLF